MGKITELAEEKKIKVIKNLMAGDIIEITSHVLQNCLLPIISRCFYFAGWNVSEKRLIVWDKRYDDRPTLPRDALPIALEGIIEIKKLQPSAR